MLAIVFKNEFTNCSNFWYRKRRIVNSPNPLLPKMPSENFAYLNIWQCQIKILPFCKFGNYKISLQFDFTFSIRPPSSFWFSAELYATYRSICACTEFWENPCVQEIFVRILGVCVVWERHNHLEPSCFLSHTLSLSRLMKIVLVLTSDSPNPDESEASDKRISLRYRDQRLGSMKQDRGRQLEPVTQAARTLIDVLLFLIDNCSIFAEYILVFATWPFAFFISAFVRLRIWQREYDGVSRPLRRRHPSRQRATWMITAKNFPTHHLYGFLGFLFPDNEFLYSDFWFKKSAKKLNILS